jgi:3-hydroxyacyl-CoA dehydrogenase/enoyl-CoA hydratase/3-hydroxybutyryl-CoA epimerase
MTQSDTSQTTGQTSSQTSAVRYERDTDGIVTLVLDDPTSSANTMNQLYSDSMAAAVDRLEAERAEPGVTGVVVTSAKKTFFAGGDLKSMVQAGPDDAARIFAEVETVKAQLRRLETLGVPVVAAVNGTALGGGLEIALACHRRIVVDDPKLQLGLPEVTLGLLPGGGGVTRTVRMLGLSSALMDVLLLGPRLKPAKALELGLVDERRSCRRSRRTCASSSRAPTTRPPRRSSPRPSRGRRSTSTPPAGSSRAT